LRILKKYWWLENTKSPKEQDLSNFSIQPYLTCWFLFKSILPIWEPIPFDFRLYKGVCSLCFLFRKLVFLRFVQGSLFPLPGYVCLYVLLVSSLFRKLVLLFFIYTILTFDQKKINSTIKIKEKDIQLTKPFETIKFISQKSLQKHKHINYKYIHVGFVQVRIKLRTK
jgi:hypothetical protein